jgi:hypothetical protein
VVFPLEDAFLIANDKSIEFLILLPHLVHLLHLLEVVDLHLHALALNSTQLHAQLLSESPFFLKPARQV